MKKARTPPKTAAWIYLVHGIVNKDSLVRNHFYFRVFRQALSDVLQPAFQIIRDRNRIRVAFFVDGDFNRFLTVEPGDGFPFFIPFVNPRHIF